MSYPPDFDQTWDITAPLDSSAANLIGQDIRNLTNEVMQRMALLSGTFANRPTPETSNATWGGSGFGILYFSTDTHQIFQWNGSAWIDVSGNFGGAGIIISSGAVIMGTDTTEDLIYTGTVPAETLGSNGIINIDLSVEFGSVTSGNLAINLYYGTESFNMAPASPVTGFNQTRFLVQLRENGDAADQVVTSSILFPSSTVNNPVNSFTTDSTVDQVLKITAQKTVAANDVEFLGCSAIITPGS